FRSRPACAAGDHEGIAVPVGRGDLQVVWGQGDGAEELRPGLAHPAHPVQRNLADVALQVQGVREEQQSLLREHQLSAHGLQSALHVGASLVEHLLARGKMLLERSHAVFFRFSSQRTMPMASSTKPRKPPPMANRIPPTAPKMPPMDTGGPTATGMPAQSISYSPEEGAVKESKDSQEVSPKERVLDWYVPGSGCAPSGVYSVQVGAAVPSSAYSWITSPCSAVKVPLPPGNSSKSLPRVVTTPITAMITPMITLSARMAPPMIIRTFGAREGFEAGAGVNCGSGPEAGVAYGLDMRAPPRSATARSGYRSPGASRRGPRPRLPACPTLSSSPPTWRRNCSSASPVSSVDWTGSAAARRPLPWSAPLAPITRMPATTARPWCSPHAERSPKLTAPTTTANRRAPLVCRCCNR